MKRSTFIYYAAAGTVLVAVPALRCTSDNLPVLQKPQLLSAICDVNTVVDIGKSYCKRFPGCSRDELIDKIMNGTDGVKISRYASSTSVASLVAEKVKKDFKAGRILIIKGWVLSQTEARQCALFSLS